MYLSPATSIQTIIISLLSYHNSFLSGLLVCFYLLQLKFFL